MSDYNLNLALGQEKTLNADDIVTVFMQHEIPTPPASYDYVQHVLSYLLPQLGSHGSELVHSVWGVDPDDSSPLVRYLQQNGYDRKDQYQVTGGKLDAGEGITGYCVVLRRRSFF
jgi:hypothetical protein